ncbi:hypothetical protein ABT009_35895 [Streptomyces sp. NPDC002896]|uniref:hypothetical protein n=1 Tax=Streptomyces sp. NPDC002896 TaxID=3154438 RepID=UPI0033337296
MGAWGPYDGGNAGWTVPPPPQQPPTVGMPPAEAEPWRAVAVGLLNLTGLGLGYVLLGRWLSAAACWVATAVLLLVALPADVEGVPGGALVAYVVVVVLAAADGARSALRTRLRPALSAPIAAVLGLVLLAVPAGGAVAYDRAHDEAVEQMLLDRLAKTDKLVAAASEKDFSAAEKDYRSALSAYRALGDDHPDSRAAKLVPDRLKTYYEAVATPYGKKEYCDAVEPLTYLRTLPKSMGKDRLGSLAGWPDDRLATSLYECGVSRLGAGSGSNGGDLGELLRTFPESEQAGKVGPAVRDEIEERSSALDGDEPCTVTEALRQIGETADGLPDDPGDGLRKDADSAVESGVYACGVDEFEDGEFEDASKTLYDFADTYKGNKKAKRARQIAIAAEIAAERPAAGKKLPPSGSPGGARMPVEFSNDAPSAVEILYTGPVTGTLHLKACGKCKTYSSYAAGSLSACKDSSVKYPKTTLSLPSGDYHFLVKYSDDGDSDYAQNYADGSKIQPGYTYTQCTYVVESGIGLPSDTAPLET